MKSSKKLFLFAAALFFLVMIYLGYDISRKTTFPGSRPQLKERIEQDFTTKDSVVVDSVRQN